MNSSTQVVQRGAQRRWHLNWQDKAGCPPQKEQHAWVQRQNMMRSVGELPRVRKTVPQVEGQREEMARGGGWSQMQKGPGVA